MAITTVGSLASGHGVNTLSVSPTAIGDVLVLYLGDQYATTSVAGGGVTTWNRGETDLGGVVSVWWGIVTATGASTITIVNSAASYTLTTLATQQFHGPSGHWTQDGAACNTTGQWNGLSSGTYPPLTPTGSNELYFAMQFGNQWDGGSTAGFTYNYAVSGNGTASLVYSTSASSPTSQAPAWTSTLTSGGVRAVAILLICVPPSAPSAPTLQTPVNASYDDVSPGAFSAVYNSTDGFNQNAYALRLKLSGGSYGYWNGTDFSSSSPVWNTISTAPGASFNVSVPNGVTIPGGTFVDGHVYNWSFASQEAGANIQGAFASDLTFTAQLAPTTTVSAPSGTTYGMTQPTVTWSSVLAPSTSQTAYRIVIESGSFGAVPGSGTSAWDSGVVSSASTSILVGTPLPLNISCRAFVQVTETGPEVGAWAHSDFTLSADTPATPSAIATTTVDATSGLPEIAIAAQAYDNGLTANQSSLEANATTGWAAGANTTLAASATWAQDGTYSLRMTATASGAVSATTPTGVSGVACVPGQVVRALASFHSPASARACTVAIAFYNASGGLISTATSGATNSTTSGNGGQPFITTTAPALAAFMTLIISGAGLGTSELLYADCALVGPGTSTTWSIGGYLGTTELVILRSDGLYVRGASPANPYPIPAITQTVTVYDAEAPTNTPVTYYVFVVGTSGGRVLTGTPATTGAVTLTTGRWWVWTPGSPALAVAVNRASKIIATLSSGGDASIQFDQDEDQGEFLPFGRSDSLVVHGDMRGERFSMSMVFTSDAQLAAFAAIRGLQRVVAVRSDMGAGVYFMTMGAARPAIVLRGNRLQTGGPMRQVDMAFLPSVRPAP
jgi:hypothetical protein